MRWPVNEPPPPRSGDKRTRREFAWGKVIVGDKFVWLEPYEIHEVYFQPAGSVYGWWSETGRNVLDTYY